MGGGGGGGVRNHATPQSHTDSLRFISFGLVSIYRTASPSPTCGPRARMLSYHMLGQRLDDVLRPAVVVVTDAVALCRRQFFAQGDQERERGLGLSPLCDRGATNRWSMQARCSRAVFAFVCCDHACRVSVRFPTPVVSSRAGCFLQLLLLSTMPSCTAGDVIQRTWRPVKTQKKACAARSTWRPIVLKTCAASHNTAACRLRRLRRAARAAARVRRSSTLSTLCCRGCTRQALFPLIPMPRQRCGSYSKRRRDDRFIYPHATCAISAPGAAQALPYDERLRQAPGPQR